MWEPRPGSVLRPLSLLWYWVLCRIVYLACFAKIAKKFENRRKSASVGPTRERARRTPIFVDFQIFSRFLQNNENMPNTLSYTDPYQVRRGRAPGPLFGKNLNFKKIRLFQISGKNRKHLDRSLEAVKKSALIYKKFPLGAGVSPLSRWGRRVGLGMGRQQQIFLGSNPAGGTI